MPSRRVTVIGAGVIGLSAAHDLAIAGHEVTVVADTDTHDTVSAVAAALWFPHATEQSDAAARLLHRSRVRFDALAGDPATGVMLRPGTVVERRTDADRSWLAMTPDARDLPAADLPPGAVSGVRATLPVIVTPVYLEWLRTTARRLGVRFESRHVNAVAELRPTADVVVVAAGLLGGRLLGDDDTVYPIRGQVVRLANPGLTDWLLDDEHPDGLTYVLPRIDDVIVGGTGEAGSWDLEADPKTEAGILERAVALVPELRGLPVLSRRVGLRPARPTIRLECVAPDAAGGMATIAAYGHGGAGVSLSWGTAERIVDLVHEVG